MKKQLSQQEIQFIKDAVDQDEIAESNGLKSIDADLAIKLARDEIKARKTALYEVYGKSKSNSVKEL
jgi:hypothetical protein